MRQVNKTLFMQEKIQEALSVLKDNQPDGPYYGCFSGGKDSVVIKALAEMAGINVDWHYHPALDPPELLRFIRRHHPDVVWTKPKKPIFQFLINNGMPTPVLRFCCRIIKESHANKQTKILGVRAAESARRAGLWKPYQFGVAAPIVYWSDDDVWSFIRSQGLPYCELYDEGFDRLGCVGCPLATQKKRELYFARWPRYEHWWKRSCFRLWENKADDAAWIQRQKDAGINSAAEHWEIWRGDIRAHFAARGKGMIRSCGEDLDLWSHQQ